MGLWTNAKREDMTAQICLATSQQRPFGKVFVIKTRMDWWVFYLVEWISYFRQKRCLFIPKIRVWFVHTRERYFFNIHHSG